MNDNEYIEDVITNFFPKDGYPENIRESMEYSLFGGGKRIRPKLILMTSRMVGGDIDTVKPFIAAIEMLHTYSLIHDDLPCMDNDDFRRGKPTSHKMFGETLAVLTGDALLNLAYETIILNMVESDNYKKCMRLLCENSGVKGLIGGQVIDSLYFYNDLSTVEYVNENKTGKLIKTAVLIGGLSKQDLSNEELLHLSEFGYLLGMIFQLTDDIIDNESSLSEMNKTTYVSLFGVEACTKKIKALQNKCYEELSFFNDRSKELKDFTSMLADRTK